MLQRVAACCSVLQPPRYAIHIKTLAPHVLVTCGQLYLGLGGTHMSKQSNTHQKRPFKERHTDTYKRRAHAKQPNTCQTTNTCQKTTIYHKQMSCVEYVIHISKEPNTYQKSPIKNPTHIKRDLQKNPIHIKRDLQKGSTDITRGLNRWIS